jgi:hypothetical protein
MVRTDLIPDFPSCSAATLTSEGPAGVLRRAADSHLGRLDRIKRRQLRELLEAPVQRDSGAAHQPPGYGPMSPGR